MKRFIPFLAVGAFMCGMITMNIMGGMAAREAEAAQASHVPVYSLIRTDIWTREAFVEDYNMSFDDCVDALWASDEAEDGMGWECSAQPNGVIEDYQG